MKKKILIVIDSLNSGGAEKSLTNLLSVFDYELYEIDLLVLNEGGLYEELVNINVKKLESLDIFKIMSKNLKELIVSHKFFDLLWRIKLSILIKLRKNFLKIKHGAQVIWPIIDKKIPKLNKNYDIAIAYSQGIPTYYVASKVKAAKKISWVNTDYINAGYSRELDLKFYEEFNYIVAVSDKCKNILEKVYPEYKSKIRVVYDIISSDLVENMSKFGEGFNDCFNGIRILTIARLVPLKGYDLAIEAACILKKQGINFKWYSIGEGQLKEELKNKVHENKLEENFEFIGTKINPYPFIKQCDIYCQPSRFEGFGMAIAEAKILNKPIVSTKFEAIYDQLENEKNGLITEFDSVDIAKGILRYIENNELREKMIGALKKEVNHREKEIDKIYELILT